MKIAMLIHYFELQNYLCKNKIGTYYDGNFEREGTQNKT